MSIPRELAVTRLNKVFRTTFEDNDISIFDAMTAEDVPGWDSVMHIALMVGVENEFGIELNAEEIADFSHVGQLIDLAAERSPA